MDMAGADQQPLRVLQLEDNADDAELAAAQLRRGGLRFTARRVETREALVDALATFRPDVVLADFQLPAFDGRAALALIRASQPDLPVIMVSGCLGDEAAVELVMAGARDFVLKDRLARLPAAVRQAMAEAAERRAGIESEALRLETETWFRAIFDVAPVATVIASASGHVQRINAAFTALLGYAAEDVWGRPVEDFTHPDDRPLTAANVAALGQDVIATRQYEKRYLHKDGHAVWAQATVSGADVRGRRFLVGQLFDLTGIRAANLAARVAHDRLRTAMEGAGAGVWDTDVVAKTMVWDATLRRQYGLREDQPTPDLAGWLRLVHRDDRERLAAALQDTLRDGRDCFDQEFRVPCAEAMHWFRAFGRTFRDGTGRTVRSSGINIDITAAKEAALDRERLADIVKHSQDAIISATLDLRITTWNTGAEAMFGYTAAEAVGMPVQRLIARERHALLATRLATLHATGALQLETIGLHKDGARLDLEGSVSSVMSRGTLGFSTIVRDVTARKQAQRALQLKESELREAQRVARIGNWELDPATGIGRWSAEVYRLFGRDPTQPAPNFSERLLLEDCDTRLRAAVQKSMETGAPYDEDVCFMHPQLGLRWLSVCGEPSRDADGRIAALRGTVQDITERKLAEQNSRESQQRFEEIAQAISEVFWIADSGLNRVLYVSPGYQRLWGRSCASVYADPSSFLEGVHPEDRERVATAHHELAAGAGFECEYRVVRPDGSVREVLDRGYPVAGASTGQPGRAVGVTVDITERKQQDRALARVNRALKALSQGNSALVHASTEQELYDRMTQAVVEAGGYKMAWVGLVEPDNGGRLRRVGVAGDTTGYAEQAAASYKDEPPGVESSGHCVRTGQTLLTPDIFADACMAPWHDAARVAGFRRCISLPLAGAGEVLGVLNIYSGDSDAFQPDELRLLEEMASDLAFGIVTLRLRTEHEQGAARLERTMEATIQALANTVEMRDPYTSGHQGRVAAIAAAIGRKLGLADDRLRGLHLAASIHDIGKLCVPAEILAKPGKLTPAEFALIQQHPEAGARILEGIEFPWPIREMVWQHHERLDGKGYPRGLKGDEILLESRILTVADVLEAVSAHRPYRAALGVKAALGVLEKGRGTRFDERAVDACVALYGDVTEIKLEAAA